MDMFSLSRAIARPDWLDECKTRVVGSLQELSDLVDEVLSQPKPCVASDIETTGLDARVYRADQLDIIEKIRREKPIQYREWSPSEIEWVHKVGHTTIDKVCGIGLSPNGIRGYYIPLRHRPWDANCSNLPIPQTVEILKKLYANATIVEHHSKYDNEVMEYDLGIPMSGISLHDTMIKHYVLNSNAKRHGLKGLAKDLLDMSMIELEDLFPHAVGKGKKERVEVQNLFPEEIEEYGCSDVIVTYRLDKFLDYHCWIKRGTRIDQHSHFSHPNGSMRVKEVDSFKNLVQSLENPINNEKQHGEWVNLFVFQRDLLSIEHRLVDAIRDTERRRVKLNIPMLEQNKANIIVKLAKIEREILSELGEKALVRIESEPNPWYCSLRSARDLSVLIYHNLGFKPLENFAGTTGPGAGNKAAVDATASTDAAILADLIKENPKNKNITILQKILDYRALDKALMSYYEPVLQSVDPNGEARISYSPWSVDTGRLAARSGNYLVDGYSEVQWHAIPSPDELSPQEVNDLKSMVVPREGYILCSADFSGEELRIAANLSREEKWIKEFLEGTGDLHSITARILYDLGDNGTPTKSQRQAGTRTNFAKLYGGGGPAIARAVGAADASEGWRLAGKLESGLPGIAAWQKRQESVAKQLGFVVTAAKRVRLVPQMFPDVADEREFRKIYAYGVRTSINTVVQGTAADIIKLAMSLLRNRFKKEGWSMDIVAMLHNVHDEILFEINLKWLHKVIPVIVECMEMKNILMKLWGWVVPLVIEPAIGMDWTAKYKWESIHKPPCENCKDGIPAESKKDYECGKCGRQVVPKEWGVSQEDIDAETSKISSHATLKVLQPKEEPRPVPVMLQSGVIRYKLASPLSKRTAQLLFTAVNASQGSEPLVVYDSVGNVIFDESEGIKIDYNLFKENVDKHHLVGVLN